MKLPSPPKVVRRVRLNEDGDVTRMARGLEEACFEILIMRREVKVG